MTERCLVGGLCLVLGLCGMASGQTVVNNCDDASQWRGGTQETELKQEGGGAIRWVPAEQLELSTAAIPHDWTGGNLLRFWLHSKRATGSRLWFILPSETPTIEGPDYYSFVLRLDWEGWREIKAPFDEIGKARFPVGWHKIESFRIHAAWDPAIKANPEDALVIDDISIEQGATRGTGPRMTDDEFFAALNLERTGLEQVKAAVEAGDLEAAKARFREYFLARRDAKWMRNWWDAPGRPEKRPNTSRADETLQHVYYFDGKRYELGPDIDWASNQRSEGESATIEWNASLNRHFVLTGLADAWRSTGEEKYAAGVVELMSDWIRKCPVLLFSSGNSPYHYAWETLNTACRAGDTWIEGLFRSADAPAWTADALVMVVKSLAEQARHLVEHPSTANWLTAESKAVVIVGTLFPEFKEADGWRETGIERLYRQMDQEVYPDGIENELALGYGLWVLSNYANVFDLALLNNRRDEIPGDYQALLERMYNYVLYAMAPDWTTPGFNDSWSANTQAQLRKGAEYFAQRKDFLWAASKGQEGEKPERTSYAFDYSGHYVMRSGWDPQAMFLIFDAGPFGSGHQHEDKLNFMMYAHGKHWITEGGVYMYDASRWRRYVLSTRAHNTARVDGQDQSHRTVRESHVLPYPFKPLDNPWETGDEFDYVAGSYDLGYGPKHDIQVQHRREILFVKPDYWVIVDTFTPQDTAAHEYETLFHIEAPEASVARTSAVSVADGKRLDIIGVGEGLRAEIIKGKEDEPVQGWGGKPWKAIPTAVFRNSAAGQVTNVYVLYPSATDVTGPAVDRIATDAGFAARISFPDGTAHYVVKPGSRTEGGGAVQVGPVTTDAELCLVKVTAEGKVAGLFSLKGTQVQFR